MRWELIRLGSQTSSRHPSSLKNIFKKYLFIHLAVWGLFDRQDLQPSLQHARSLSCSMWDPVLWPGIEPGPLRWEHEVLDTGPQGSGGPPDTLFCLPGGDHESCQKSLGHSHGELERVLSYNYEIYQWENYNGVDCKPVNGREKQVHRWHYLFIFFFFFK